MHLLKVIFLLLLNWIVLCQGNSIFKTMEFPSDSWMPLLLREMIGVNGKIECGAYCLAYDDQNCSAFFYSPKKGSCTLADMNSQIGNQSQQKTWNVGNVKMGII